MGLLAGRNVALFSIVAPMVLTRHADPALDSAANRLGIRLAGTASPGKRTTRLNVLILVLLAVAVISKVALIYPEKTNTEAFKAYLPLGVVEYFHKYQPEGRLFNSYNWGGYCSGACRITRFSWMGAPICTMMRSSING